MGNNKITPINQAGRATSSQLSSPNNPNQFDLSNTLNQFDSGLPDVLSDQLSSLPSIPKTKDEIEIREMTYNAVFEYVLDHVASGRPLTSCLRNDPRNIDVAKLLRWIRKDPGRKGRYEEAEEIAADILADKSQHYVNMESEIPVDRLTFMFNHLKWITAAKNKKKYGNNKHVELEARSLDDDAIKKLSTEKLMQMLAEQEGIDPESLYEDELGVNGDE